MNSLFSGSGTPSVSIGISIMITTSLECGMCDCCSEDGRKKLTGARDNELYTEYYLRFQF